MSPGSVVTRYVPRSTTRVAEAKASRRPKPGSSNQRPDRERSARFDALHHTRIESGTRFDIGVTLKRSQHRRVYLEQSKFIGAFIARFEMRLKFLGHLPGGAR